MRFKTSALKEAKHQELVSCVAWVSPDDVLSIADDGKVLKWNLVNSESKEFAELPQDFHPTDVHLFPRAGINATISGSNKKVMAPTGGASDTFLVTSAEGKMQLMSGKNGRVEKSVEAHRYMVLVLKSQSIHLDCF